MSKVLRVNSSKKASKLMKYSKNKKTMTLQLKHQSKSAALQVGKNNHLQVIVYPPVTSRISTSPASPVDEVK